jgi:CRP-like cAMP-binding protein
MLTARRDLKHRVAALRRVPFIAGCSSRELERLDRLGTLVDVRAGKILTREGEVGRECFVVLDGTAVVHREGRPIGEIGPGSIVGELALLDNTLRNATVVATTAMRVLVLDVREFDQLLAAAPSIETAMGHIAAARR